MWTIIQHPDVKEWRKGLDEANAALVVDALADWPRKVLGLVGRS